jgi:hypothetical protein
MLLKEAQRPEAQERQERKKILDSNQSAVLPPLPKIVVRVEPKPGK